MFSDWRGSNMQRPALSRLFLEILLSEEPVEMPFRTETLKEICNAIPTYNYF